MNNLVFLKLGGSLITDKKTPRTAREELIKHIAMEIAQAMNDDPLLQLILGHGSGSFGHYSGKKHGTRDGVSSQNEWYGFSEVRYDAALLNNLVMRNLKSAGLAAISFPPSSAIITSNKVIHEWDLSLLISALNRNLLPVVYGDVVFDEKIGGTILSTEELFIHLAQKLNPSKILLAGIDQGVWQDFPDCTTLIQEITPINYSIYAESIGASDSPDITGGMATKVNQMLELIQKIPQLSVQIFSGIEPGNITKVLSGQTIGTIINR
jgi:isopentenyl phosphate kinase